MRNTYTLYQIDAFTHTVFKGNPAAVVSFTEFPSDEILQSIAAENNLAETAFVVKRPDGDNGKGGSYDLRWFTPTLEMDFCGHATIAASHALIHEMGETAPLTFHAQIGILRVDHGPAGYTLIAPKFKARTLPVDAFMTTAFGKTILSAYIANNLYIELPNAADVESHVPDMSAITALLAHHSTPDNILGVSLMAKGGHKKAGKYDFVSRHFCPLHGIDEDPVTGSAHSGLGPIWADRLGKAHLLALQCSSRAGELSLNVTSDTVEITGKAITYLRGEIIFNKP